MYQLLKNFLKSILPQRLLIAQEARFRRVLAYFYRGTKHQCNICNTTLSHFIPSEKGDLLCPSCGSLNRNRRLWQLLQTEAFVGKRVLEFSPSRCLFRKWKSMSNVAYLATDYEDEFLADVKWDITNLPQNAGQFDYIICYHILEHITDDEKAMQNLYRVLADTGKMWIQTPFKTGEIYENPAIQTPEEREKHFGQADHVRIYSVESLRQRLEKQGFQVETLHFVEPSDNYYGFGESEVVLVITK